MDTLSRPFLRMSGPRFRGIRFRYEKAGLTVADEPIPWNAEAVLVEAVVRLPPGTVPRKSDFQLCIADRAPRIAVALERDADQEAIRAVFRLPPIQGPTLAAVHYQGSMLGQVLLPFLAAETFLRHLCLRTPTIFALLDKHNVACRTVVEGQCRGLSAGGILASPTSLLPIADFDLRVDVADRATGCVQSLSLPLTGAQLLGKEALLSLTLPPCARGAGTNTVQWIVGDRLLAHAEVCVISPAAFQQSLYLAEGRFLSQDRQGIALFRHHLRAHDDRNGLRPCFVIASHQPGIAALCSLDVRVQFCDPDSRPVLGNQQILVTDKAALLAPDLSAVADFRQVRAFELLSNGQLLGVLPLRPTPAAAFTSEGGFYPTADFDWTPFNEEELFDRLEKLMEPSAEASSVPGHASQESDARDLTLAYWTAAYQTREVARTPRS